MPEGKKTAPKKVPSGNQRDASASYRDLLVGAAILFIGILIGAFLFGSQASFYGMHGPGTPGRMMFGDSEFRDAMYEHMREELEEHRETERKEDPLQGAERPPEIMMTADGETIAGVEGSYCYNQLCVDKIGPRMLVAESDVEFTAVSPGDELVLSIDAELRGPMTVSVLSEDAEPEPLASTDITADADGMYIYTLPDGIEGEVYITAFVRFAQGGDASYVFPVRGE